MKFSIFTMDDQISRVRKSGTYHKLKNNRKKFFVLREIHKEDYIQPILEYYDSEKKFKSDPLRPKHSIELCTCFAVGKRYDPKKFILVIYTGEDLFGIIFNKEEELKDWYADMLLVMTSAGWIKPEFDHIWQVTLKPQGLAAPRGKLLPGVYRLCLLDRTVTFYLLGSKEAVLNLQLGAARKCGHAHTQFFMELGHASQIGQGELWMTAENSIVASDLHDNVLKAMRNSSDDEQPRPHVARKRSDSTGGDFVGKKIPMRPKTYSVGSKPGGGSFRALRQSPGNTYARKAPERNAKSVCLENLTTGISVLERERADSMESRSSRHSHTDASSGTEDRPVTADDKLQHSLLKDPLMSQSQSSANEDIDRWQEDSYMPVDYTKAPTIVQSQDLEDSYTSYTSAEQEDYLKMSPHSSQGVERNSQRPFRASSSLTPVSLDYTLSVPTANISGVKMQYDASSYMDMELSQPLYSSKELFGSGSLEGTPRSGTPSSLKTDDQLMMFDFKSSRESLGTGVSADFRDRSSSASSRGDMSSRHASFSKEFRIERTPSNVSAGPFRERAESSASQVMRKQKLPEFMNNEPDMRGRAQSAGNRLDVKKPGMYKSPQITASIPFQSILPEEKKYNKTQNFRPRTATVCQDSIRVRTSGFGQEDSQGRPRSSSYSNTKQKGCPHKTRTKEVPLQKEVLLQNMQNFETLSLTTGNLRKRDGTLTDSADFVQDSDDSTKNVLEIDPSKHNYLSAGMGGAAGQQNPSSHLTVDTGTADPVNPTAQDSIRFVAPEKISTLNSGYPGLEKLVSPILEEDNESLYGPKPKEKAVGTPVEDRSKHAYVNVGTGLSNISAVAPFPTLSKLPLPFDNLVSTMCRDRAASIGKVASQTPSDKVIGGNSVENNPFQKGPRTDHEYTEISFEPKTKKIEHDVQGLKTPLPTVPIASFNKSNEETNEENESKQDSKKQQMPKQLDKESAPVKQDNSSVIEDIFNLGGVPIIPVQSRTISPSFEKTEVTIVGTSSSEGTEMVQEAQVSFEKDIFGLETKPLENIQTSSLVYGQHSSPLHRQVSAGPILTHEEGSIPSPPIKSHGSLSSLNPLVDGSTSIKSDRGFSPSKLSLQSDTALSGFVSNLNYATLDLNMADDDETLQINLSPRSSLCSQLSPLGPQPSTHPVSYAEIDFEKSEQIKTLKAVRDDHLVTNLSGINRDTPKADGCSTSLTEEPP